MFMCMCGHHVSPRIYLCLCRSSLSVCLCLSVYAAMDEMELPPGASADKAMNICGEIMKAKHDYVRAKVA